MKVNMSDHPILEILPFEEIRLPGENAKPYKVADAHVSTCCSSDKVEHAESVPYMNRIDPCPTLILERILARREREAGFLELTPSEAVVLAGTPMELRSFDGKCTPASQDKALQG
eukprot:3616351-Amphidinium_carterae.1